MNLDSNIPLPEPEAPKPRRGRKPKTTAIAVPNPAQDLINALKFIKPAQAKAGTVQQIYSMISGHWLAASNGILTIGVKIQEDLTACPHSYDLLEALGNCEGDLSITQLSARNLSIKSGNFKAIIECCEPSELTITGPDSNVAQINNQIKFAIDVVMPLAIEGAMNAAYSAVCLQAGSAVATNGSALIEAWHGVDLPPGLMLPKAAALAVARSGKALTGFGYSSSSATFWFEDGSFIKAQLYKERFPEYKHILDRARNLWLVKKEFMHAVKAIAAFSRNEIIYMDKGLLSSREGESTSFKTEGLPDGMAFNAKFLMLCEHAIKHIAFDKANNELHFSADNVRGCLKAVGEMKKPVSGPANLVDDDIPF